LLLHEAVLGKLGHEIRRLAVECILQTVKCALHAVDHLRHVSLLFHCTRCFVLVFLFWFLPLPMPCFFRFPRILRLPFLILSPWLLLLL
jgi:hypothetical protein